MLLGVAFFEGPGFCARDFLPVPFGPVLLGGSIIRPPSRDDGGYGGRGWCGGGVASPLDEVLGEEGGMGLWGCASLVMIRRASGRAVVHVMGCLGSV